MRLDSEFTRLQQPLRSQHCTASHRGAVPLFAGALLAAKADPNAKCKEYASPAHVCALKGKTEALQALLAAGADKEAEDENGCVTCTSPVEIPTNFLCQHLCQAHGAAIQFKIRTGVPGWLFQQAHSIRSAGFGPSTWLRVPAVCLPSRLF